ncbi:caspase family protein [Actinokineospora cianjurensis]|uniref:Caspase domain-containing protein n=1 Tax=Actinokineospora cianjurensis TaxID=585224 RepID=A0A421AUG3_9PSEU|nr:caspase family protein [Actinokineospora cianjurensis]RLK53701.1 caspase domain-containing protein [Actinokineospora cianjurensis]
MARHALIVANRDYRDPGLRALRAPEADARELAAVLGDPAIGEFAVSTELDLPASATSEAVEGFFADRDGDDLLLLYFSGHGVKDPSGDLHFATATTRLDRLGSTAVSAEFVSRQMDRTRARQVVLLLDCCYAGAFHRGMVARAGEQVGVEERFRGRGRAVITASSAMEYAFEGSELTDSAPAPSVFTAALVEGLRTGDADRDQDGFVGLDELYDHVYDRVRAATPNQTPGKWVFDLRGDLRVARRARPVTVPAELPEQVRDAVGHLLVSVREGVVKDLARLLTSGHEGKALAARLALLDLAEDDSRRVAAAAAAVLATHSPAPEPAPVAPSPTPRAVLAEVAPGPVDVSETLPDDVGPTTVNDPTPSLAAPSQTTLAPAVPTHRAQNPTTAPRVDRRIPEPVDLSDHVPDLDLDGVLGPRRTPVPHARRTRISSTAVPRRPVTVVVLAVAAAAVLAATAPTQLVVLLNHAAAQLAMTPIATVFTPAARWLLVATLIAVVAVPRDHLPAVGLPLAMVGIAYATKMNSLVAAGQAIEYTMLTPFLVGLVLAVGCLVLDGAARLLPEPLFRPHPLALIVCVVLAVDLFAPNAYDDPRWLIPLGVCLVLVSAYNVNVILVHRKAGRSILVDALFPLCLLANLGYAALSNPLVPTKSMYIASVVIGLAAQVCLTGRPLLIARIGIVAALLIHIPLVFNTPLAMAYMHTAIGLAAVALVIWGDRATDTESGARSM